MDKSFKIKVTDERTGRTDTITLDPCYPFDVQLSIGIFGRVILQPPETMEHCSCNIRFAVNKEHDYKIQTLLRVVHAVGSLFSGTIIWEVEKINPSTADELKAFLTITLPRDDRSE